MRIVAWVNHLINSIIYFNRYTSYLQFSFFRWVDVEIILKPCSFSLLFLKGNPEHSVYTLEEADVKELRHENFIHGFF